MSVRYYVGSQKVDVAEEKVEEFLRKYPDAIEGIPFSHQQKDYFVPSNQVQVFKNQFPKAVQRVPKPIEVDTEIAENEVEFQRWYAGIAKARGISLNPYSRQNQYDIRGYYDRYKDDPEEMAKIQEPGSHFPSEFKGDFHPDRMVKQDGKWLDTKEGKVVSDEQHKNWDRARKLIINDAAKYQREVWSEDYQEFLAPDSPKLSKRQKESNKIERDVLDLSMSEKVGEHLKAGQRGLLAADVLISLIPAGIYMLGALPQNLLSLVPKYADDLIALSYLPGNSWMKPLAEAGQKYPKFFKSLETAPPKWMTHNIITKYYAEQLKHAQATMTKFDNTIWGYLKEGKFNHALALTSIQITEAIPLQMAIMGAAWAGVPLPTIMTIVGAGSAGEKFVELSADPEDLKREIFESSGLEPQDAKGDAWIRDYNSKIAGELGLEKYYETTDDISIITKQINALIHGAAEGVFEGMGTARLGKIYGAFRRQFGEEAGQLLMKRAVGKSFVRSLSNKGVIFTDRAIEGVEEFTTQLVQNLNDIYTGVNPELNAWSGTFDAFVIGIGASTATTMPLQLQSRHAQKKFERSIDKGIDETLKGIRGERDKQVSEVNKYLERNGHIVSDKTKAEMERVSREAKETAAKKIEEHETLRETLKDEKKIVGAGNIVLADGIEISDEVSAAEIEQLKAETQTEEGRANLEKAKSISDPKLRQLQVQYILLADKRAAFEFGTAEWVAVTRELAYVAGNTEDRIDDIQKKTVATIKKTIKHFEKLDTADEQIYELSKLARTMQDDIDAGIMTLAEAKRQIEEHGYDPITMTPEEFIILGSNEEVMIEEARKDLIKIFKGANPLTVVEERSHSWYKNESRLDAEFENKVTQWKKEYEESIGEIINKSNVEWFATLARRYAAGVEPKGKIHKELRKILDSVRHYFNTMFGEAQAFGNLVAEGRINEELIDYLDRSVNEKSDVRTANIMKLIDKKKVPVKKKAETKKKTELQEKKTEPKKKRKYKKVETKPKEKPATKQKKKRKYVKPKTKPPTKKVIAPKKKAPVVKEKTVKEQQAAKKLKLIHPEVVQLGQTIYVPAQKQPGKFFQAKITKILTDSKGKANRVEYEGRAIKGASVSGVQGLDNIYIEHLGKAPTKPKVTPKVEPAGEVKVGQEVVVKHSRTKDLYRVKITTLFKTNEKLTHVGFKINGKPHKVTLGSIIKLGGITEAVVKKVTPTKAKTETAKQAAARRQKAAYLAKKKLKAQVAKKEKPKVISKKKGKKPSKRLVKAPLPTTVAQQQAQDQAMIDYFRETHPDGMPESAQDELDTMRDELLESSSIAMDDKVVDDFIDRQESDKVERDDKGRRSIKNYDMVSIREAMMGNPELIKFQEGVVVKGDDGLPLILYHGTRGDEFHKNMFYTSPNIAGWFTPNPDYALQFTFLDWADVAQMQKPQIDVKYRERMLKYVQGARQYQVISSLKKPVYMKVDASEEIKTYPEFMAHLRDAGVKEGAVKELEKSFKHDLDLFIKDKMPGKKKGYEMSGWETSKAGNVLNMNYREESIKIFAYMDNDKVGEVLQKYGYDCMYIDESGEDTYLIFNNKNIKSIWNTGTFSKKTPDINYDLVPVDKVLADMELSINKHELMRELMAGIPQNKALKKAMKYDVRELIILRRGFLSSKMIDLKRLVHTIDKLTTKKERELIPFIIEKTGIPKALNRPDLEAMYDRYINDPEFMKIVEAADKHFQRIWKEMQLYYPDLSTEQRLAYVPHIWDIGIFKGEKHKNVTNWFMTKNPFLKKRYIETLMEGVTEHGLTPNELDISQLIMTHGKTTYRAMANAQFIEDVKKMNYNNIPMITTLANAPGDWKMMTHPALQRLIFSSRKDGKGIQVSSQNVMVHPDIEGALKVILEQTTSTSFMRAYDMVNGFIKKMVLSLSLFHHIALTETGIAMMGWRKTWKVVNPVAVIYKGFIKKEVLAYSKMPLARDAAEHILQLGASGDMPIARIQQGLRRLESKYKDTPIANVLTTVLRGFNERWDFALWDWLHDGLKLYAYESQVLKISKSVTGEELRKTKIEIAQIVNDTFGGQNFDVLMFKPSTVKRFQRGLLSFDWQVSTLRQAVSWTGIGAIYKSGVPLKTRRKIGTAFWLRAFFYYGLGMNLLNALFRYWDMEDNPEYYQKGEYGWWDYTMFRNVVGQKTRLFVGRYDTGHERYIRWGKQFREFPELLFNDKGKFVLGAPMLKKLGSKIAPVVQKGAELMTGSSLSGFENWNLKDAQGWAWTWQAVVAIAQTPLPFSMRNLIYAHKEYKVTDIGFPSSKGATKRGLIDRYELALKSYDTKTDIDDIKKEILGLDYTAVQNGIDPMPLFMAALSKVEAQAANELTRGSRTIKELLEKKVKAKTSAERRIIQDRITKIRKENILFKRGARNIGKQIIYIEKHVKTMEELK